MKADVSRADLLHYLFVADEDNLALIADCFGYQYTPRFERVSESLMCGSFVELAPLTSGVMASQPATESPPERFCRLIHISPSELVPALDENEVSHLPDWMDGTTALDLEAPKRNNNAPPPPKQEPLVAWSRLWPVLQAILSEQQTKKRPDLPKLVKTIAKGYLPTRIPQQQRQNWTAGLRILIDRPQRLQLFNHDYLHLLSQLKKLRGEVGLVKEMLEEYPGGPVRTGYGMQARKTWQMPEPGTPLLILSDLGIYETSGQAEKQWLAFGRKLQAAGSKAYVLMPVPARYLSQELANYYQCISWDRFSALAVLKVTDATAHALEQRKRRDKKRVDELLAWLSPLVELEPALLRAIRHRLPDKPLDVSFEAQVWNHEDAVSNTTYLSFSAEKVSAYRESFMQQAEQNRAKAARLYALVKRYHAHTFFLDYYEEIIALAKAANCVDDVLLEAERYLKQFVKAVYEREQHGGLAYHSQALLNRQPEAIKRNQDVLSSLWGILKSRSDTPEDRPDWLNNAQAVPFLNLPQIRQHYRLVQQGENLYLGNEASLVTLMPAPLFTLAEFDANSSLLVEERMPQGQGGQKVDYQLQETAFIQWSSAIEPRRLHVNGDCYTLEALPKPGWATAIGRDQQGLFVTVPWLDEPRLYWQNPTQEQAGQWTGHELLGVDEYGLYVDLTIKGITQRYRWLEPGTFLMGSPETEPERYEDEVQHSVTLTQGFWLADTTVTQALWQAVMDENPSGFKNDQNNPVENVSWDDAQAFIGKLNERIPGLQAKLPSEAQWEYACRAGTKTPFNFGCNITPELVNYDGDTPYAGGKKGLNRRKTVAVKSLPANPWGLYEMHGNVWEWCQDYWSEQLPYEPAFDPTGPDTGAERIVRGGSWSRDGRYARSACRGGYVAVLRNYYLGFRLALGLELRPSQASTSGGGTGRRVAEQRQTVPSPEAEAPGTLARVKDTLNKLKKRWKGEP